MEYLLVLIMFSPLIGLFGYLFFGFPYGLYKAQQVENLIKNEKLMKKMQKTIIKGLVRVDKKQYILYKPKERIKNMPIHFRFYQPNRWKVVFSTPFNEEFIDVTFVDGVITNVYGDNEERQELAREYFTLLQKPFTEMITELDKREREYNKNKFGYDPEINLRSVQEVIHELISNTHPEGEICEKVVGRFTIRYTVDGGFVVFKLYYLKHEICEGTHDQQSGKDVQLSYKQVQYMNSEMWKYFEEEIKPSIKEFLKTVNRHVKRSVMPQEAKSWEEKIRELLDSRESNDLKEEFAEIQKLYQSMNGGHQKQAKAIYEQALEKLFKSMMEKETVEVENEIDD
ncbi:hypothetical protein CN918_26890 [Priestia megaterium]|nr:hypothetical protein CN918_26890 [Priestia megaterium]